MSPVNHANISYSCNRLCLDETSFIANNVFFLSYIKAETKKMAAEDSSTPGIYVLCVSIYDVYITRHKKDASAIIKATLSSL
jgi:hypothetical protein